MNFKKNIKGISFRSHGFQNKNKNPTKEYFNLDELYLEIKKETPMPFSNSDIRQFLQDHGRQELNGRISQCIDAYSKWNGILKAFERTMPNRHFLHFSTLHDIDEKKSDWPQSEVEIYILMKKLRDLWKHNLCILEMSAQAQFIFRKF